MAHPDGVAAGVASIRQGREAAQAGNRWRSMPPITPSSVWHWPGMAHDVHG